MNLTTVEAALTLLEKGVGFAWLTIVDSLGSSPRHSGTSMLVRPDGTTVGTIGGGPLEGTATASALEVIESRASRLMNYNLTSEDSARLGMICGGRGVVLIDYVDPGAPGPREYFAALRDLLEAGGKGWMVSTVPETSESGWTARSCLVRADWLVFGDPACSDSTLRGALQPSGARKRDLAGPGTMTFFQPAGLQGAAYVFGAGHCGEKLIPVLSSVGFYTVVIDDREAFANAARFPSADRIVVPDSFEGVVSKLPIDEDSYVVIVTRGHSHDKTVLQQALATEAGYVGMIGSRKKTAAIFESLQDDGVSAESIARVFAPIGLEIGAESPEEIAVSIAAQLIQVRASRRL